MSFKQIEKKDCLVYIPEVAPGAVSVLVFYPGIDIGSGSGKVYMPPLIKKAVPDWYNKFVIVIPFQHTRKWSSVKTQYEEEIKKFNLTVANLSLGIFSGSGNGSADIQKSLYGIASDIKSYGTGLTNFIMMDPSASADLTTNVNKIKELNKLKFTKANELSANAVITYFYLMYNDGNWSEYKTLQAGFVSLAKETEYKQGSMSSFGLDDDPTEYFPNVKKVKSSHMDIPTEMLVFYKAKIESSLVSPALGSSNPVSVPSPPVVYKLYVDMGGVLFQKSSDDETSANDSLAYTGVTIWDSIKKYNPTILSAVGTTNKETIIANRKAQIKANLIPEPPSLFVDSGSQKDQYAEKSAILIDDSKVNIEAWVKKGGIGIQHDPTDTLNGVKKTVEALDKIIGSQSAAGMSFSNLAGVTGGSGGTGGTGGTAAVPTIQMYVVFPNDFIAKAREDVPKFTVWVGPIQPEEPVEGFTELFSDDEVETLGENQYTNEYIEAEFSGPDEIIEYNATDDEPMGDYYFDADGNLVSNLPSTSTTTTTTGTEGGGTGEVSNVSVGSSAVGPGPPAGSKLMTGSGKTWYIGSAGLGIAGHRLKPILGDLQKHLRANGYPSAEIGNNGITRDLVASVYPNSPARAVASLHGAGLAIDVTFKIPGKKWAGIGDNRNLADDPQLTKVISNFVKAQGDITWGASYDKKKGSDPANGIVKGRGVTEYHHFEISADKIANYWKPYESDLKSMGFDYKTLNKYGRDSPIYKVMKQLLNSKGIG